MSNRTGATKLEVTAALLAVTLTIGICLAGYVRTVRRGEETACATCRSLTIRLYKLYALTDGDCTLSDAVAGKCESFNTLISGAGCPYGGVYTVSDGNIVCSRHGS